MEATIYRRHQKDCRSEDRYDPRCGCPLWFQFNWKGESGQFDSRKLKHGQNKWSSELTSMSKAQAAWKKLSEDLDALLEGKPVRNTIGIETAIQKWLEFREQHGKGNTKADLMGRKLIDWCANNSVMLVTQITTEKAINFRMSLPFRTGDSSSLAVHWAVMNQFFNWCEGMGYIEKNPCPNPKLMPQFRIEFDKPEVQPPTSKEVERVLLTATAEVRLLLELMRWSGMALVDAQQFDQYTWEGSVIRGNRQKTKERFRVRIPQQLAESLKALGKFGGTYREWRERCYKVFRQAKVKMTPHGFRHFRISEWLSQGVAPHDVADMVGTSEKEIKRTYAHWIKEREDRLDEVQRQAWIKQGLDANGNSREAVQ
jgi:integrase